MFAEDRGVLLMMRVSRTGVHERSNETANWLQIKWLPVRLVLQRPREQVP